MLVSVLTRYMRQLFNTNVNKGSVSRSSTRFHWKGASIILLLTLVPITDTLAQSGGFSGAFTRMGFGPRGMSMGNALGTVSEEGIYAHYNPALVAYADSRNFDMSTALMSFDRSLNAINISFPLPPNAGLNIGLLNANVRDIDGRTTSGYHTEYMSTHEFQLFAAFGINVSSNIKFGAAVKLQLANLHENIDNATGAGFDLGIIIEPTSNWRIGVAAQDIISEYNWSTSDLYGSEGGRSRSDPFPTRYRFSTSYRLTDWDLLLSSEFEIQRQSAEYQRLQVAEGVLPPQSITSSENVTTSSQQFRIGAAWSAHERMTLRGGWEVLDLEYLEETHKISAGISVHLPYDALRPSVDYTFVREPFGISGMHVLAMRLSF